MGRAKPKRYGCVTSTAGMTTRWQAPRPTATSPRALRSIPSASRSWATVSAAITRRALLPSRSAMRPQSRWAPCTGTSMIWSPATRPTSQPTRAEAPPRSSNSAGSWARPDNETALEWAKKFTLEGIAQRIECAFLVLHGENDRIVLLTEAKKLYERVGSKRKHIKIFTAQEGGAEHCQVDHRQLGIDYIGDWLLANM